VATDAMAAHADDFLDDEWYDRRVGGPEEKEEEEAFPSVAVRGILV